MSKKIFRSIMTVAILVLLAGSFIAGGFLYNYFSDTLVSQMKSELSLLSGKVDSMGAAYFDYYDSSVYRFTLIDGDGKVLYDTRADAGTMENHLEREEIARAAKTGYGSSKRYSKTLTQRTFYEAKRLSDGKILRVSVSQVTVVALMMGVAPALAAVVAVSVALALFLSNRMTKTIVRPLNRLDLEHPTENDCYEEIAPILTKLNKQHRQIDRQMKELKRKSDEFVQITDSMSEGLVLLDKDGKILSINNRAKDIFKAGDDAVGRQFITVYRSLEMNTAVEKALCGTHSEYRRRQNGREYRFYINCIKSDGAIIGAVIMCLDVTEQAFAERNRREFTANVSHELKTPLQTIVGSAELLENNMVKPEDVPRFLGNIKSEATRMVRLINDIIRLSQLDEGAELPSEEVDLYAVAKEAVDTLRESADKKNIEIELSGNECKMNGIQRYLYETVYNLCDNAIRYTDRGGKVSVNVKRSGDTATLRVSDNGIGIPPEHQSRIFERFYRVDKSHSRRTGGTGLGLSIVKHAVAYHNGKIELDSTPGKGTTITVTFKTDR